MRLNQFIAGATGLSRRASDVAIREGRVSLNGKVATLGLQVGAEDHVELDSLTLQQAKPQYLLLNKPMGYVCSRSGQGSKTIYSLIPDEFHHLKPVGRLDKDSCGLLLLTNDGQLAQHLTHPRYQKLKAYKVQLDKPLGLHDLERLKHGINLGDGPSHLSIRTRKDHYLVQMREGRNRQIRRTFRALGFHVTHLERVQFGKWNTQDLHDHQYRLISLSK